MDDNHDAAASLARLLRILGYEVSIAFDGVSAVERAESDILDAILMDIGLPGMNG